MKQKVGPAAIIAGICALAVVVFVLYRVFLPAPAPALAPGQGFQRPGYNPSAGPPTSAQNQTPSTPRSGPPHP